MTLKNRHATRTFNKFPNGDASGFNVKKLDPPKSSWWTEAKTRGEFYNRQAREAKRMAGIESTTIRVGQGGLPVLMVDAEVWPRVR